MNMAWMPIGWLAKSADLIATLFDHKSDYITSWGQEATDLQRIALLELLMPVHQAVTPYDTGNTECDQPTE